MKFTSPDGRTAEGGTAREVVEALRAAAHTDAQALAGYMQEVLERCWAFDLRPMASTLGGVSASPTEAECLLWLGELARAGVGELEEG